jgi:hypothetical protein
VDTMVNRSTMHIASAMETNVVYRWYVATVWRNCLVSKFIGFILKQRLWITVHASQRWTMTSHSQSDTLLIYSAISPACTYPAWMNWPKDSSQRELRLIATSLNVLLVSH